MTASLSAPAKLNLGLEIIRRRGDGYHDLATIFQAIDMYDELTFSSQPRFEYRGPPDIPPDVDLVRPILETAARDQNWTGLITLTKAIPLAAGLGGGSSDAALALRLAAGETLPEPSEAVKIGADVPFFLSGGTARARGIGDDLIPMPPPDLNFVMHVPPLAIPKKTRTLFGGLEPGDFTDGSAVADIADIFIAGGIPDRLPNAFERQLREYAEFNRAWAMLEDIAGRVALSGAGPSIFSWHRSRYEAARVAQMMQSTCSGLTYLCRAIPSLTDEQALRKFRQLLLVSDCP